MPGAAPAHRAADACRVCGSSALHVFLSLGEMPLANAFLRPDAVRAPEPRYPLEAMRCERCGLVQLTVVVRPEIMFSEYPYASSASAPMVEHFAGYADEVVTRFRLAGSHVVEIGSNDGILLSALTARGVRALGVEPASNLAALANAAGLETLDRFFSSDTAREIATARGRARAIVANNVLAHIDDLADVLAGLELLLDEDGIFIFEVPYLLDLLQNVE